MKLHSTHKKPFTFGDAMFGTASNICAWMLFVLVIFTGCKKNDFGISIEARLIGNTWKMRSLSDYDTNVDFQVTNTTYEFKSDGTYIISSSDLSEKLYSTWELLDNKQYLKIGNNTFKLSYISKRLLGLRYGGLALFYVPAK